MTKLEFEGSAALQLLQDLEKRQDEALLQIDQLNERIEATLRQYAPFKQQEETERQEETKQLEEAEWVAAGESSN